MEMISTDPEAVCYGKVKFATGAEADKARKSVSKRRGGALSRKLMAYRCADCGYLHLGRALSKPPRKISALKRKFKPERR